MERTPAASPLHPDDAAEEKQKKREKPKERESKCRKIKQGGGGASHLCLLNKVRKHCII